MHPYSAKYIAKLLHFHKCNFDKWFFPPSFLSTLLSFLFPLSSPAPSFFLSLSLFYFRFLKVSQIHGNVTNTRKHTLLEPFTNHLVTCYVCTLNRAGYMSNRLFFHNGSKTCGGLDKNGPHRLVSECLGSGLRSGGLFRVGVALLQEMCH